MRKRRNMKLGKRVATMLLVLMLTITGMPVIPTQAAGSSSVTAPKYENGEYMYNSSDVFGAATHVHLFGRKVVTTAHTHGNVMAEVADISEIGMRAEKIDYPQAYTEYSYFQDDVVNISAYMHCSAVFGSGTGTDIDTYGTLVKGTKTLDNSGVEAVNFDDEFATLIARNQEFASVTANSSGVSVDLSTDMNNRVIFTNQTANPNGNTYINIPFSEWESSSNYIRITGLDRNSAHTGLVIINMDLNGQTNVDLTSGDMKAFDSLGNSYSNMEYTTDAFGSCRVLYNFYDSSQTDKVYRGTITFGNTVFGSILAPGATVYVGAINGNVMADTIYHHGQESHRLDLYPVFKETTAITQPTGDIMLYLEQKDEGISPSEGAASGTSYTLYSDAECTTKVIDSTSAVWSSTVNKYSVVMDADSLQLNTTYYLKKDSINTNYSMDYSDNNAVYECYMNGDGTITYRKYGSGSAFSHTILTDVIVKSDAEIGEIKLTLNAGGLSSPVGGIGTESGTVYKLYIDSSATTPVPGIGEIPAVWDGTNYVAMITKEQATAALNTGTTYYFKEYKVTSGYTGDGASIAVTVGDDGAISGALTDTITKKTIGDITINMTLEDQTTDPGSGTGSGISYGIYSDAGCNTLVTEMGEAISNGNNLYSVTLPSSTATEKLNADSVYYIAKNDQTAGTGYADNDAVYQFKVQSDGTILYKAPGADSYTTTIPTDSLAADTSNAGSSTGANGGTGGSTGNESNGNNENAGNTGNTGNAGAGNAESGNGGGLTSATPNNISSGGNTVSQGNIPEEDGDSTEDNDTGGNSNTTNDAGTGGDSNSVTSADTGEVNVFGWFAGYCVCLFMVGMIYVVSVNHMQKNKKR